MTHQDTRFVEGRLVASVDDQGNAVDLDYPDTYDFLPPQNVIPGTTHCYDADGVENFGPNGEYDNC